MNRMKMMEMGFRRRFMTSATRGEQRLITKPMDRGNTRPTTNTKPALLSIDNKYIPII